MVPLRPHSYVEVISPTPQSQNVTGLGDRAFKEAIQVTGGPEGGPQSHATGGPVRRGGVDTHRAPGLPVQTGTPCAHGEKASRAGETGSEAAGQPAPSCLRLCVRPPEPCEESLLWLQLLVRGTLSQRPEPGPLQVGPGDRRTCVSRRAGSVTMLRPMPPGVNAGEG